MSESKNIVSRIQDMLSGGSVFFVLFALGGRLLQVLYFFNFRVDRSYQAVGTWQLISGHGVSQAIVSAGDLSVVQYHAISHWPSGYSFLLSPFVLLCRGNFTTAGLLLDLVAAAVLFFSMRNLGKLLGLPLHLLNLYTLVLGFFIYQFYFISSSDSVAAACFMLAIRQSIYLLGKGRYRTFSLALIIAMLFLSGWIKFMFIPIAMVVPGYLLLRSWKQKDRELLRGAGVIGILLFLGFLLMLWWHQSNAGRAVEVVNTGKGFFPENLKNFYPFIPHSFMRYDMAAFLIAPFSSDQFVYRFFQVVQVVAWVVLFFLAVRYWKKKSQLSVRLDYFFLFVLTSVATLAVLVALSLRNGSIQERDLRWTFVLEARYYAMLAVAVHLVFFIGWFRKKALPSFIKLLLYPMALFLFLETVHGMYFDLKRILSAGKEQYSWQYDLEMQKNIDTEIKTLQKTYHPNHWVLASSLDYVGNRISWYSKLPLLSEPLKLNAPETIKTSASTGLVFLLHHSDTSYYPRFRQLHSSEYVNNWGDLDIYYFSFSSTNGEAIQSVQKVIKEKQ